MRDSVAVPVGPGGVGSDGKVGTEGARRKRGPDRKPLAERFWAKVQMSGPLMPGMDTPCWTWDGAHSKEGYGQISEGGHCGRMLRASRVALEMRLGRKLEKAEDACHRCDNPACVRGDHLFPGSRSANMKDCAAKGRLSDARLASKNRGERNGRAKLTEAQAEEIRARYATETAAQLAAAFGVTKHTVYAVVPERRQRATPRRQRRAPRARDQPGLARAADGVRRRGRPLRSRRGLRGVRGGVMPRTTKKTPARGPRRAGAVLVGYTEEEHEEVRGAAEREALPLATWIRALTLREARRRAEQ